jgi:uncharacterized protein YjbJ (UPF0337 family)
MADKAKVQTERTDGRIKEQIGEATGDEQLTDEGKVERVVDAVKQAGHDLRDKVAGAGDGQQGDR